MTKPKKHFYTAASPEVTQSSKCYKPAADFELRTGLTGIAGWYAFLKGLSPWEYETKIRKAYGGKKVMGCYETIGSHRVQVRDVPKKLLRGMQKDWQALVTANPELARVPMDTNSGHDLFTGLMGVASLFNVDDIAFFLGLRKATGNDLPAACAREVIAGYEARRDVVQERVGAHACWVVSPATLEKMEKKLKIGSAAQAFNAAARREVLEHQPARDFESRTRFKGIAGRYIFPQGVKPLVLEEELVRTKKGESFEAKFGGVFRDLLILNPDLHRLRFDKSSPRQFYSTMLGITSGFNVDDINYFVDLISKGEPPAFHLRSDPRLNALFRQAEHRADAPIEWVPSPETLGTVHRKLDARDGRRARKAPPQSAIQ